MTMPTPLSRLGLFFYRLTLPFRLRRQAIIRKARSASAHKGWAVRRAKAVAK